MREQKRLENYMSERMDALGRMMADRGLRIDPDQFQGIERSPNPYLPYRVFGSGSELGTWDMVTEEPSQKKKSKPKKEEKKDVPVLNAFRPGMKILDYIRDQSEKEPDKTRAKWLKTFLNCVLPERVRDVIEEALTVVLLKERFDEWGINENFEKGLTNSILIYGPPGTGKTMITESIAAVLGMNLLKVTSAQIQSQIPGQAERNISEAFSQAKKENAVVMLDECDSLLFSRNGVGAILAAEINHLLGELENHDGVVVLTTNRLGCLDEALQRRIIAKVELCLPGFEERLQIWKNLMPKKMPVENLRIEKLAEHELSGGEIKNCILLAARRAISKNLKSVDMECMAHGIASVAASKADFEKMQTKPFGTVSYQGLDKVMVA
jgi:SpoVK/Ycf46/Vps4 family AAA+-type ATPase